MDNKIRIGIDPGKNSFVCVWKDNDFTFYQLPIIGKQTDLHGINAIFAKIAENDLSNAHAVLEDVHAIFGSSAKATFEFGHINGILEAMLTAYKIPYTKVQPKAWQKEMWQGVPLQQKASSTGKTKINDTKAMSLLSAKRLFPDVNLLATSRSRVPDNNKVDALLICEYCKRKF